MPLTLSSFPAAYTTIIANHTFTASAQRTRATDSVSRRPSSLFLQSKASVSASIPSIKSQDVAVSSILALCQDMQARSSSRRSRKHPMSRSHRCGLGRHLSAVRHPLSDASQSVHFTPLFSAQPLRHVSHPSPLSQGLLSPSHAPSLTPGHRPGAPREGQRHRLPRLLRRYPRVLLLHGHVVRIPSAMTGEALTTAQVLTNQHGALRTRAN